MTWNYEYSDAATDASWAPCNGCKTTKTVEVTDPDGDVTRYTFGNRYNVSEGKVEQVDVGWNGTSALRTTTTHYRAPGAGPYPNYAGVADDAAAGDSDLLARYMPADQITTTQQGVTFTWEANAWDTLISMPRAASVTRSSTLGHSRTETTIFNDNLAKYVLGQVQSATEAGTGKVMVSNQYDPVTATVLSVSTFNHFEHSSTYYPDGTLATRTDGKNQTTTFSNYKRGIPQNIRYPNGSMEHAAVNDIGLVTSLTDANGYITNYGYDAAGRLASITYPTGDGVTWNPTSVSLQESKVAHFDLPAGHWRQEVKTGNAYEVTTYDALWRPVYSERWDNTDPAGTMHIVKRQYDAKGHVTFESYPKRSFAELGDGVTTTYDALGRITHTASSSELGILNTSVTYDEGFQKSVTDARGYTTTTRYQAFDQPVENALVGIDAPEGVSVAITRDVFSKPTAIIRSGGGKSATRRYVYDSHERLCKTIEPETGATVQDYDAANNILWRAAGLNLPSTAACDTTASVITSRKTAFGYDALNRLTTTTYADGSPQITRTYTPDGLLSTISANGSVWTNSYNKRRLNERESLTYSGAVYNIDRAYDANASLTKLTYPDGASVTYNPNALGEARQIGTYATAIRYHPNGAVASFTYGNGIVHTLTQNVRGLPLLASDGSVLRDQYSYDQNANVTGIADMQAPNTGSRTMGYDPLDRLTRASAPGLWGTAAYTYDALDNLTSTTISGGDTARSILHNFDPVTNRLTSTSNGPATYNFSFAYDLQGNLTRRGQQTFVFDQGNRMTRAVGRATYGYDGLGHRFTVVGTDGVNRVQVYSQEGQLLYVRAASVPLTAGTKYVYLNRHVVAEVKAAGAY